MPRCKLCGKSGVNAKTCPLNINCKNPHPRKHHKKPRAYNYEQFDNYINYLFNK